MPSFKDAPFSLSDEDRWALAHYVRTLQLQRKTGLSLLAKLVEKLPSDPDDPLWDSVEYLDIPMVGQVVAEPRMFSPRVDNVRVQALYDNKDVVFRLSGMISPRANRIRPPKFSKTRSRFNSR